MGRKKILKTVRFNNEFRATSAIFSPDERKLIVDGYLYAPGIRMGQVRVYRHPFVEPEIVVRRKGRRLYGVTSVNDKVISVTSAHKVEIIDLNDEPSSFVLTCQPIVRFEEVALNSNSKIVAIAGIDRSQPKPPNGRKKWIVEREHLQLWGIEGKKLKFRTNSFDGRITEIGFLRGGMLVIAAGGSQFDETGKHRGNGYGEVAIWEITTGKMVAHKWLPIPVVAMAVAPGSNTVAFVCQQEVANAEIQFHQLKNNK